jgi:hypothetical protein
VALMCVATTALMCVAMTVGSPRQRECRCSVNGRNALSGVLRHEVRAPRGARALSALCVRETQEAWPWLQFPSGCWGVVRVLVPVLVRGRGDHRVCMSVPSWWCRRQDRANPAPFLGLCVSVRVQRVSGRGSKELGAAWLRGVRGVRLRVGATLVSVRKHASASSRIRRLA